MFAEDLDVYLADFGVSVTFAGAPAGTLGIYDAHTEGFVGDEARALVNAEDHTVLLKTTVAALLTQRLAITVDGAAFKVREKLKLADGAFTLVALHDA